MLGSTPLRVILVASALVLGAGCDDAPANPDGSVTPPADGSTVRPDGAPPGDDGGRDPDGGGPIDPDGGTPMPTPAACDARTAEIVAATGETITVSPAGDGMVSVEGGGNRTLRQVVSDAAEGTTILLQDGTYTLPETSGGNYTGLYFRTPNVTLRSASGDPTAVIIDSAYRDHNGSTASITIDAPGVVLSGFTVRRSIFHLVHLWANGDDVLIHDVHLVDGGQQFLKASPGGDQRVDGVEVSCSQFRMTEAGRDNAWGYGPRDGNTACYTGGIDTHDARDWHVHDSYFEGIYCNRGGVERPAHGKLPGQRGGMTYTGGLSEHAIHMWDSESGSGHLIERNHIVNCARGIGLGFREQVYGTVIRNNMIWSDRSAGGEHDVGIEVQRGQDTQITNNTVFFASSDPYPNAIEYRYDTTSGLSIQNNLVNQQIRARNGASATLGGNVTDAEASWFVDASAGDLHLASCDVAAVVGAGEPVSDVTDDIDGEPRGAANDVGADDCAAD